MKVSHKYDDIIHREHRTSTVHAPMPAADRAAQFAPFAALTGFEGQIQQTAVAAEQKVNQQGYLETY